MQTPMISGRMTARKSWIAIAYALLTLAVSLLIFGLVIRAESEKIDANMRSEMANYGSALRTRVDRELNAQLFISWGLSSYISVYHDHLDRPKLQAMLADLYARSQHVRNLGVAIGHRIEYIYPVTTNEKALGMDYRDLPQQWPQVKLAIDSHKGVLAGPLDLMQGGSGLIYRYPIYIDGQYWGLLSTVIDTDSFLHEAFKGLADDDYEFAVRVKQEDGAPAFYGDSALFRDPLAYRMFSSVPNGQWEWAIKRKTAPETPIPMMMIMGFALSLLLASVVFHFQRERTQLTAHALQDSLTGLANRRLLQDRLQQAHAQARRFGRSMAILYIDIDHFKSLNDTYGHDFGDALLKAFAQRLAECIRNVDTLSRIGGDEFIIVLEEINQAQDVHRIAQNIQQAFVPPLEVFDINVQVSLSLGAAIYRPELKISADMLRKQADMALYEAKGAGRNTYRIYGEL